MMRRPNNNRGRQWTLQSPSHISMARHRGSGARALRELAAVVRPLFQKPWMALTESPRDARQNTIHS